MAEPQPRFQPAFHVMAKPRGPICNLDCQYCFYLKKRDLFPRGSFRMDDRTLERYIRSYIQAQHVPEANFAWQGGEPTLMGLDFFRRAVELQEAHRRPGMRVLNAIQTNGTLLDDDWCRFFAEHQFLVGISLDGPALYHDAYRVDAAGKPTFDRVMAGIELLKKHQVQYNILACVNSLTARHPAEIYHFFRDEVAAQYIQFIPIVEPAGEGATVTSRSVSGRDFGYFLTSIFDEWVRQDVGKIFIQLFDVALGVWSGHPAGLCVFEPNCGSGLAMEHNGNLYSCDHFVDAGHFLGNIHEAELETLARQPDQYQFGQDKKEKLPRACRMCPVRFMCNGGCPKDRILITAEGDPGLNFLCEGYLSFFTHIDPYMRAMADLLRQDRAPAEIMSQLPALSRKRH